MKRDLYAQLLQWKNSPRRKPLLLRGARQTGKTYILKYFGQKQYHQVHYFNFEEQSEVDQLFAQNLKPLRILSELSIYSKKKIQPKTDLIIFDEIQNSNRALNSLKYFQEQHNEFHIAAAGSMLGIKLSVPGSFPVGKVNFLDLYPLSFLEFLDAVGESRYRQYLETLKGIEPIPLPFHEALIDLLRKYYFVGGMPEAVHAYAQAQDLNPIREIQSEIIDAYVLDFVKHAKASDTPKLTLIWNSIPKHLGRENKKFIFSALKKGARAREYESALTWLKDTGLIYQANAVQDIEFPLKHHADDSCFKVYALDVGLLGALAKVPMESLVQGDKLFSSYHGALAENYIAQQVVASLGSELFYWKSKGGKAEIDFLIEVKNYIYPLEVKAGINARSKSLASFDQQFHPKLMSRTTLLNLKKDGKIINIPLYAIGLVGKAFDLQD